MSGQVSQVQYINFSAAAYVAFTADDIGKTVENLLPKIKNGQSEALYSEMSGSLSSWKLIHLRARNLQTSVDTGRIRITVIRIQQANDTIR